MSYLAYFVRECPTCGRRLEIRVAHLGKDVFCQHCGAQFVANDTDSSEVPDGEALLLRAERLITASQGTARGG